MHKLTPHDIQLAIKELERTLTRKMELDAQDEEMKLEKQRNHYDLMKAREVIRELM
jgi:rRNA processing protein Krr1/Pno1